MHIPVINENIKCEDKTFLGRLHKDHVFDIEFFRPLYNEINALSGFYADKLELPKELVKKLLRIQGAVLSYIDNHFDSNNVYEIVNLTEISYRDFLIRIEYLFEFFGIRSLSDSMFRDDFCSNP